MNVHDKTKVLLDDLMNCDFRTSVGIEKATRIIRLGLKGQDRDTRHACAEEVIKGQFWSDAADSDVIRSSHAFNSIMNCQGGIK